MKKLDQLNQLPLQKIIDFSFENQSFLNEIPINTSHFVGFSKEKIPSIKTQSKKIKEDILKTQIELLTEQENQELITFFNRQPKISVGMNTIQIKYGTNESGILRNTFYDYNFATSLYLKTIKHIDPFIEKDGKIFLFLNYNPLIRFIFYNNNNQKLIPHYDLPVVLNQQILSLKTLVLYLTTSESGSTSFLKEHRENHMFQDSNEIFEVLDRQTPIKKLGIIFDHYKLHESEPIKNNEKKIIITTELFYKQTNLEDINFLLNT